MLDLARGPFVVGVADRVEALAACAKIARGARPFDLVEARVDLFSNQRLDPAGLAACAALEASGTPVLVTIRSATQGGRFAAGESVRLERFREAIAAASWADIEDDAQIIGEVAALVGARPDGQLVVSHHDFSETPSLDTLQGWVDACHAAAEGAVAKVATAIRSPSDAATLQALLRARPARTAVIGMSAEDRGLRVALAAAGSLLAYGYLSQPTAPGQMSAHALHDRLREASPSYADRRERSLAI
jgi:3-dehydroquinate dehydratase-1